MENRVWHVCGSGFRTLALQTKGNCGLGQLSKFIQLLVSIYGHHLLEWFSCLPMYNITYTLPIHTSYTQYQAVLADAVLKTQIWSSSFFNGLIKNLQTRDPGTIYVL